MTAAAPSPQELARRLRAALAYGGLSRAEAAEILSVSLATLDRITGRKGTEFKPASWTQLWAIADEVDLPREWFSADLQRLDEIPLPGMPVFSRPEERADEVRRRNLQQAREQAAAARRRQREEQSPPDQRERSQGNES
jgi:transcriptional regulator with XRE-family HTH domain